MKHEKNNISGVADAEMWREVQAHINSLKARIKELESLETVWTRENARLTGELVHCMAALLRDERTIKAQAKHLFRNERERTMLKKAVADLERKFEESELNSAKTLLNTASSLMGKINEIAPWTCSDCGPHIRVDEDGCCGTCGKDATRNEDHPQENQDDAASPAD